MRPMDLTKFRKSLTKNITTVSEGFRDPKIWISTGNYALNYRISKDYNKGFPLGRVCMLAGESGSGKSFLASGNAVKQAQDQGIQVILIDTEGALDQGWLENFGIDTDKIMKINASMVNEVAQIINEFMTMYKSEYDDKPENERPPVLFVLDSIGMLSTPAQIDQFEKGDMKGDMGIKAKQLKALVTRCVNMFVPYDIGMIVTNHSYSSQDIFDPEDKISGGSGFIYAASIIIGMKKLKLKEDEDGNKTSTVNGIKAKCKIMKSRYNKPFETVDVKIPYDQGMDPYSGLVEMYEAMGLLVKDGNSLRCTLNDVKQFRKKWQSNENGCLDELMNLHLQYYANIEDEDELEPEVLPEDTSVTQEEE